MESNIYFGPTMDLSTRAGKIEYLTNHYKYSPSRGRVGWAANVKLHTLNLTETELTKAYDLVEAENFFEEIIQPSIDEFESTMHKTFTIYAAGRSNGYLVLHRANVPYCMDASYIDEVSDDELNYEVNILKAFDQACDNIMHNFRDVLASDCETVETTVIIKTTKIVKTLSW